MTIKMTATEAKAKILALLDEAATGQDVEITKHGRTVARLIPASGLKSIKGTFEGVAITASEKDDLLGMEAEWNLP